VTLDTENLLIEAVDAIIAQAGEDLNESYLSILPWKTDDKSWDISREILDTGRLVLMKITEMKSPISIKPLPNL
jgi:hypothetical protein